MTDEIEITAKLEQAAAAAVRSAYQGTGTALNGLAVYCAQQGGLIGDADRLILSAINPDDELAHAGIFDVELYVVLFTKATTVEGERSTRAKPHQKRAAEIGAIFSDRNHDQLCNQLRATEGFGVSCFMRDGNDERGLSDDETCWVWRRKLIVTCHLAD